GRNTARCANKNQERPASREDTTARLLRSARGASSPGSPRRPPKNQRAEWPHLVDRQSAPRAPMSARPPENLSAIRPRGRRDTPASFPRSCVERKAVPSTSTLLQPSTDW